MEELQQSLRKSGSCLFKSDSWCWRLLLSCQLSAVQFPGGWLLVCLAFSSLWLFSAYERHGRVGHDQQMGDQGIFITNVTPLMIACFLYSTKHEECSNHVYNMGHYYLVNIPSFWVHNNAIAPGVLELQIWTLFRGWWLYWSKDSECDIYFTAA